ncbi:MAG: YggS family pyridoxal phosphate-dependent enzyme [Myxococcota bacterium]
MALSDVSRRLEAVRARVAAACRSAGRDPAEVTLVAVSKRHGPERIREAYDAGQRVFGENYVQELVGKAEALAELADLRFRFIGHLQRNKAKYLVRVRAACDGLGDLRAAEALARRVGEGPPLPVLVQVNVAGEAQKSGAAPADLPALVREIRALPALRLEGLMTVPPAGDPERARPVFRSLRELAAKEGLAALSMGMSADLEVAIEEGATLVRVGTAIFGPRPPGPRP